MKMFKMLFNNSGEVGEELDREDLIREQAYEERAAEKEGREPKDLLSTPEKEEKPEGDTQPDIIEVAVAV